MRGGRVLVGGLLAAALAGGGAAAVVLQEPGVPPGPPVPTPIADPGPAPSRTPLLPELDPAAESPAPSAAALSALVDGALADPALGGRLAVSVVDVGAGEALHEREADVLLLPASTAKIVTAAAALTTLPDDAGLRTRVVAGPEPGDVVVVGGGDTTLATDEPARRSPQDASLDALAAQVRAALAGAPVRRVLVDDTLYTGPATGPGWTPAYVGAGNVAPVSALTVDAGRVRPDRPARVPDPALAAGERLAGLLAAGAPPPEVLRGTAPGGSRELGVVESAPIPTLVERMLAASDNDLAESLARQVALAEGQPASFDGVAVALSAAAGRLLEPLGVAADAVRLVDGSGLSRDNLLAPGALPRLLAAVTSGEPGELSPLLSGLPVAGFDGTLAERYRSPPSSVGAGVVRAKTGTLRDVSALAGVVRTADGRLLAFDLVAPAVPGGANRAAERVLDRLAASFAACGCR